MVAEILSQIEDAVDLVSGKVVLAQ